MVLSRCIFAGSLSLLASPVASLFMHSSRAVATSHPIEDVISMLKDLGSKVEQEGKTEELDYVKFEHWCSRSQKSLTEAVASAKTNLEETQEGIEANTQTIESLTAELSTLVEELAETQAAGTAADTQRGEALTLATAEMLALTNTIQACKDALAEMTTSRTTVSLLEPGLLQERIADVLALADARISDKGRSLLQTFNTSSNATVRPVLKAAGDDADHVDVYAFKSGEVVELLKNLQAEFEADFTQREKEETASVNEYDLAKAARADLISAANAAKLAKETSRGQANTTLIFLEGEETNLQSDISADTATLSTTEQACQTRATEWAERSKVRDGERQALEAAMEILAKATGVRTEKPTNPTMPPSPVAFFQLEQPGSNAVKTALRLLRQEAGVSHSSAIAQLANAVAAASKDPIGSGHFDQVINSVEKMIFQLMNEQKEEDDHKNWCDKELEKTNVNIQDKLDKIGELSGKIGVAQGRAGTLKGEITSAEDMVADIVQHVEEATEIRKEGKEQNALAVKDAEAGQTALVQAVSVLKDFYKSSGGMTKEAWEFVQAPVTLPSSPALWGSPYTGVADPVGDPAAQPAGIITVLETVSSDFALMESNTRAQEEVDQTAFAEDLKECAIEKARRSKEAEVKQQERQRILAEVASMTAARASVTKEKEAGDQYLSDLQPACVEGSSTYADRKAARATEITALKAAQAHLQDAFENVTVS